MPTVSLRPNTTHQKQQPPQPDHHQPQSHTQPESHTQSPSLNNTPYKLDDKAEDSILPFNIYGMHIIQHTQTNIFKSENVLGSENILAIGSSHTSITYSHVTPTTSYISTSSFQASPTPIKKLLNGKNEMCNGISKSALDMSLKLLNINFGVIIRCKNRIKV
eukprot:965749_1